MTSGGQVDVVAVFGRRHDQLGRGLVGQVTDREVVIGDGVELHVETVVVGREVVREVDPGDRIPRLFQTARDDDGEADERTVGAFPVLSGFEGRAPGPPGARGISLRHRPAVACATSGGVGVSWTWAIRRTHWDV